MSLDKAKAALEAAKEFAPSPQDATTNPQYHRLLDVASVQASIAQADALDRIATALENRV